MIIPPLLVVVYRHDILYSCVLHGDGVCFLVLKGHV